MTPTTAQVIAWIIMGLAIFAVYIRYGVSSFPFFFLLGAWFYLLFIPTVVGPYDPITGTTGFATETYYGNTLIYCLFYPLGVRLIAKKAFLTRIAQADDSLYQNLRNWKYNAALSMFVMLSIVLCAFSILSRNVFDRGGELLFTIVGFDFLLVAYLINRTQRTLFWNLVFFGALALLFAYAGFRYRIALLFLTEVVFYISKRGSIFVKFAMILATLFGILFLAAIGQVRSYGSFTTLQSLDTVEFSPLDLIAASGEQTVFFTTVNIVENLSELEIVGLQPITILLTHFIPSAIYPEKPRADYLGAYLDVSTGLENSGAAMHDMAQATLMFGHLGLPLAALLLGMVGGLTLRFGLRLAPNRYYACCLIILCAIFIPSRGYLAQQITWGLTFILPLIMLNITRRLIYGSK